LSASCRFENIEKNLGFINIGDDEDLLKISYTERQSSKLIILDAIVHGHVGKIRRAKGSDTISLDIISGKALRWHLPPGHTSNEIFFYSALALIWVKLLLLSGVQCTYKRSRVLTGLDHRN
jgi:hypothetical protein